MVGRSALGNMVASLPTFMRRLQNSCHRVVDVFTDPANSSWISHVLLLQDAALTVLILRLVPCKLYLTCYPLLL